MTDQPTQDAIGSLRRCFTYCGPDRCNCPAKELHETLEFVSPAFPVLETLCRVAGLDGGGRVAKEMGDTVSDAIKARRLP